MNRRQFSWFNPPSIEMKTAIHAIQHGRLLELLLLHEALLKDLQALRSCVNLGDNSSAAKSDTKALWLEPWLRPSDAVQRHRIASKLIAVGIFKDYSACKKYSTYALQELLSDYEKMSSWLGQLLESFEQTIIDTAPQNRKEAKTKAQLLLSLIKEDGIYDVDLLAFAVEECLEYL